MQQGLAWAGRHWEQVGLGEPNVAGAGGSPGSWGALAAGMGLCLCGHF